MDLHELTLGHGSPMLLACTLLRHISVSATTPANSPHALSPSSATAVRVRALFDLTFGTRSARP